MTEELDREVEDFARRLNSDWPERMQEILSLDPERRLVPLSMNDNRYFRTTKQRRRRFNPRHSSSVVLLEGSRDINRQQEAKKIEAPKGQVSHSKRSTDVESPSGSSVILLRRLCDLIPQPIHKCENPP